MYFIGKHFCVFEYLFYNLGMKRDEKVFLFHQGRNQNFDGAGEADKKRVQILRGPLNGV